MNFVTPEKRNNPTYFDNEEFTAETIADFGAIGFGLFRLRDIRDDRSKAAYDMAISTGDIALNEDGSQIIPEGQKNPAIGPVNNRSDAYRHFTWNATMTKEFGSGAAQKVADNHELYSKAGYGRIPSSRMDL